MNLKLVLVLISELSGERGFKLQLRVLQLRLLLWLLRSLQREFRLRGVLNTTVKNTYVFNLMLNIFITAEGNCILGSEIMYFDENT